MSSLFSKKNLKQQDIQEGQVPDDVSDQSVHSPKRIQNISESIILDKRLDYHDQQFIFQTVPDAQIQPQYKQREKVSFKSYDYNINAQSPRKKEWERSQKEKEKNIEKNSIQIQKRDNLNLQNKRKKQNEEIRTPLNTSSQQLNSLPINYYPPPISMAHGGYLQSSNIPSNIPSSLPHNYYPVYPTVSSMLTMGPNLQLGTRSPYGIYQAPNVHNMPPNPYTPPYSYQNLGIYPYGTQNPSPSYNANQNPYGTQNPTFISPYSTSNSITNQNYSVHIKDQKYFETQGVVSSQINQQSYQQNKQISRHQQNQKIKQVQNYPKYSQDRQRSRQKRQKDQRKQRYNQNQNYYGNNSNTNLQRAKQRQKLRQKQRQKQKQKQKTSKLLKKQFQEQKNKLKFQIQKKINYLFQNQQKKQEFLYILRDILKHISMQKQQQENRFKSINQSSTSTKITLQNKEIIQNNYEKSIMKLQKIIYQPQKSFNFKQFALNQSKNQIKQEDNKINSQINSIEMKKQYLLQILKLLDMQNILVRIKQNRLKKKLIGEKRTSQIKKLLDELIKNPRRRVK